MVFDGHNFIRIVYLSNWRLPVDASSVRELLRATVDAVDPETFRTEICRSDTEMANTVPDFFCGVWM